MKKIALVTGASRGIGRSIAVKFLKEGYIVYGTFFESEERINELVNKYGKDNFKKIGPYNFSRTEDSFKLVEDVAGIEFDTLVLKDGTRQLFIDSFISEESMGYVIENDMMIDSLLEVFENIYSNIMEKKIEVYQSNN